MLVAPREIVDVVYRASRVVGADSGVASMIGRSACFSAGQLGGQLDNVVSALDAGEHPLDGFSVIAALEVDAARSGDAELSLESPITVADLAFAAFGACRRGTSITMICADGEQHSPHSWLGAGRSALGVISVVALHEDVDQGVLSRVDSRHGEVLRHGVHVPQATWQRIHEHAAGYLVSEALIDSAEATPPS